MGVVDFPQQGTIGTTLKPKRFDIDIYQGDTFQFYLNFTGTGLDMTGWTGTADIQKMSDSSPGETPTLGVTLDAPNTRFLVDLTDTETAALAEATAYKYDIQVTDASGNKRTFIGGKITVTEDITEP